MAAVDKSGLIEPGEVLRILRDLAPDAVPDAADAELLVKQCDLNGDGAIDRNELLPLIGAWLALAREKIKEIEEREAQEREDEFFNRSISLNKLGGSMSNLKATLPIGRSSGSKPDVAPIAEAGPSEGAPSGSAVSAVPAAAKSSSACAIL